MAKPKKVVATGTAVGRLGGEVVAKRIEAATIKAIEDANANGITDPEKVRAAIIKARDEAIGAA